MRPEPKIAPDRGGLVVLGAVLAYLPFTLLGYGTDIDAANVLRAGGTFVRTGHYEMSRRPGSLVHEIGTGYLERLGGSVAINLIGVAFVGLTLWGVLVLARRDGQRWPAWTPLLVAANPWFWLAGTSLGDFVWAIGLAIGGAVAAARNHRLLAGVLFGLAIGCRLSTVLVAASWLAAARMSDREARPPWRATLLTLGVLGVVGAAVFVPSWLAVGHSLEFLSHQPPYPGLAINLGRWAVKNAAVVGLPAGVVLVLSARGMAGAVTRWSGSVLVRFAVLVAITGELLFLRFPWKPVHLLPVVLAVALVLGASPTIKQRWLAALVVAQLLGGLVGTTIAQPDVPHHARSGKPELHLREGPLLNDMRCRLDDRRHGPWPDAADPEHFSAALARSTSLFDCQSDTWKAVPSTYP